MITHKDVLKKEIDYSQVTRLIRTGDGPILPEVNLLMSHKNFAQGGSKIIPTL